MLLYRIELSLQNVLVTLRDLRHSSDNGKASCRRTRSITASRGIFSSAHVTDLSNIHRPIPMCAWCPCRWIRPLPFQPPLAVYRWQYGSGHPQIIATLLSRILDGRKADHVMRHSLPASILLATTKIWSKRLMKHKRLSAFETSSNTWLQAAGMNELQQNLTTL